MGGNDRKVHYGCYNDNEYIDEHTKATTERLERQLNTYSTKQMDRISLKDKYTISIHDKSYFSIHKDRGEKEKKLQKR